MSGRPSAATERALKLVEKHGLAPFAAAKQAGISPSTIYRALAKKSTMPRNREPSDLVGILAAKKRRS